MSEVNDCGIHKIERLRYYLRKLLWFNDYLFHGRRARNEMTYRKLLGTLLGCRATECIFNKEGHCENVNHYSFWKLEPVPASIVSCSDAIYLDGRDWTDRT